MKNILFIISLSVLFFACVGDPIKSISEDKKSAKTVVEESGVQK